MVAMLRLVVALTIVACAHAQVVELGACRNYLGSTNFNEEYISKIKTSEEEYSVVLSSGSSNKCQKLVLFGNNTFKYSFEDDINIERNYTGEYTTQATNFVGAGFITLNLPPGVFGANLFGSLLLNVLEAEANTLVVASCVTIGVVRAEQIHVMVPSTEAISTDVRALKASLIEKAVPNSDRLSEIGLVCAGVSRGSLTEFFEFLIKIGIIPIETVEYASNDDFAFSQLSQAFNDPSVASRIVQHAAAPQFAQFAQYAAPGSPISGVPYSQYPTSPAFPSSGALAQYFAPQPTYQAPIAQSQFTAQQVYRTAAAPQQVYRTAAAPQQVYPTAAAPQQVYPTAAAPQQVYPKSIAAQQLYSSGAASQQVYRTAAAPQQVYPTAAAPQ